MRDAPRVTRRGLLAAGGALGVNAVAGCVATGGSTTVSVLSAGSLSVLFNETVGPAFTNATDYEYRGEFHGSNAVMRLVRDGQKEPDVVVSADAALLREKLIDAPDPVASWDVAFASNEVGITYAPDSAVGQRLATDEPWYEVLREADAEIARSDPDLDPLGYRTVQLFDLAERHYDEPGMADQLESNLVIDPNETHLLAGIETGDRTAAVVYKNMAADHGLPFRSLPPELNFADPSLADWYATATYTTEGGHVVEGTPVLYNATIPTDVPHPDAARSFLGFLLDHPARLRENGLVVGDAHPIANGPVPEGVMP